MDNVTQREPWPLYVHEQVEWEVAAAREAGIREGLEIAAGAYHSAIAAALVKPDVHGGPDLEAQARATVYGMFRRYFGVGMFLRDVAAPELARRLGPR